MAFVGVYRAVYEYAPQAEGELAIQEGDLLFILDKSSDDDWWKAKKKAIAENEDEPVGLVPNNYIEEAHPIRSARALYEYTRQTEEELSFPEDAQLKVYDTSDPDWILVGLNDEYGFVPANYVEFAEDVTGEEATAADHMAVVEPPASQLSPSSPPPAPTIQTRAEPVAQTAAAHLSASPVAATGPPDPATALAAALGQNAARARSESSRAHSSNILPQSTSSPPPQPRVVTATSVDLSHDASDMASPTLPARPVPRLEPKESSGATNAPSFPSGSTRQEFDSVNPSPHSPGGFRLYNINEMVSMAGKRRKVPTTLGVNLATGVIMIAPEQTRDGRTQEWTGDMMTHYSREGKHVFLELVQPSRSIDFHAGAKDTAEEIVRVLGELAGAIKAEGLMEVIAASKGSTRKTGVVLYDFVAQGDDEVSVNVDDEVVVLDDRLSDEWWKVRRVRNGKEGVVPSSYVQVTSKSRMSMIANPTPVLTTVQQNRLEEKRLAREALQHNNTGSTTQGPARSSSSARSKPDPSKVRTWTDRSKTFSVEAQFLGVKDGKLNLHKTNGVKIAVPLSKMSLEDVSFVEQTIGRPLMDRPKISGDRRTNTGASQSSVTPSSSLAPPEPQKPEYDWFQFFLSCDIAVGLCDRYAKAFISDSMDESVLPAVDAGVLRNLGFREGDIIKVMRFLDSKFGRNKAKEGEAEGGLFSSEGGKLLNNTRKGRPAPSNQASNVVDAKSLSPDQLESANDNKLPTAAGGNVARSGFDDDAWDVKPSRTGTSHSATANRAPENGADPSSSTTTSQSSLTAGMKELSLLSQPLEPIKIQPTSTETKADAAAPLPGATPSFFDIVGSLDASKTGNGATPMSAPIFPQATGINSFVASRSITPVQGQVAPPGKSLHEITQARLQQQITSQQEQIRLMQQQQQQLSASNMMMPQRTGLLPQQTGMMPMGVQNTFASHQPSAMFMVGGAAPLQPQLTRITGPVNTFLPAPLEPQRTAASLPMPSPQQPPMPGLGMTPQYSAAAGFMQQRQPFGLATPQPLMAQPTGPAPTVKFGVQPDAKKLEPQPTGRRANLSQATPDNPFGF